MSAADDGASCGGDGVRTVEVSDLWDAFHAIADRTWRDFHYRRTSIDDPVPEPAFGELMDILEHDLFLPACARRVRESAGVEIDPDDVAERIRLADGAGEWLDAEASIFEHHGFDRGEPYDDAIENRVVCGDLALRERPHVRLFVLVDELDA